MRLLVSGATATIRRLVEHPTWRERAQASLGHLLTPSNGNTIESLLATGLPIAIDNGAFAFFQRGVSFDWKAYTAFVASIADVWHTDARLRERLRFVTAPDAVGDWRTTARMWRTWVQLLDRRMQPLPWAYVAQNGQVANRLPFQGDPRAGRWVGVGALFIGGDTAWKLSAHAQAMVMDAKRHGRWVHVGRVNSLRRLRHIDAWGVDSFDGGQFSMFPDTYIPRYLALLRYKQQPLEGLAA